LAKNGCFYRGEGVQLQMIRFGILIISDRSSRGEREDLSGPALMKEITRPDWLVAKTGLVPDEIELIRHTLQEWADSGSVDIILTSGGTGFTARDVTPEATLTVIDRPAPGLAEAMRAESLKITPHAMLSRAVAGIREKTLIINFPGSPKAAVESFRVVAPVLDHAVELLTDAAVPDSHHQRSSN
jgi:molybdopterin adenylyltransferase